jgi:hypothetical protein
MFFCNRFKITLAITPGGISMCHPTSSMPNTCLIDVVSNIHSPGFKAFQQEMTVILQQEFNASPHLGKYLPSDYQPQGAALFANALNQFYRDHHLELQKSPFLTGHFCRLLGLSEFAPEYEWVASATPVREPDRASL